MQLTKIDTTFLQEGRNQSSHNIKLLLEEKSSITERADILSRQIQASQLGKGHKIRKLFAINATYFSVMFAPLTLLLGGFVFFGPKFQDISAKTVAKCATLLGSLKGSDYLFKKLLGIEPLQACFWIAFDVYRQGALSIAKEVGMGYDLQESEFAVLKARVHRDLFKHLESVYSKAAKNTSQLSLSDATTLLTKSLPKAEKELQKIGLDPFEAKQVTLSLKTSLEKRLKTFSKQNTPSVETSPKSLLSQAIHRIWPGA